MTAKSTESVLLSLGSNIEPEVHLVLATRLLARRLDVVAVSHVFETSPVGARGVALFLNAAVLVLCGLEPRQLKFDVLRPLERELGRIRSADRNAPRTIDVDISLFGDRILSDPEASLEIPDPEILTRAHVALPLADLAPDLPHPQTGERLADVAARFRDQPGVRIYPRLKLWPLTEAGEPRVSGGRSGAGDRDVPAG